jgi:mannose-1-phosphate guanylyltransferase
MLRLVNSCKREEYCANPSTDASSKHIALLLAGGDGTRLQELTREIAGVPIPKQYCRLLNGSSLLEATLSRAQLFAPRERISVVVNQDHIGLAREQLKALPEPNVLVQPLNRDTGPGLIFALLQLERAYGDAIVAAFPTDHYIDNDRAFIAHVLRAANAISRLPDKIAILGIVPERPETGYGYILPAGSLESSERAFHVEAFMEKPNINNVRSIISRGGLWNTFVMVFRLSRMLQLISETVPDGHQMISALRAFPGATTEFYRTLRGWNLSAQFLAGIPQHLIIVKVADVGWSDWGTRESIERTYRSLKMAPSWNMSPSVSNAASG